ncbi:hypothetical protein CMV_026959 [Castanea mollissima]|uniref:Peptidase M1 membrane alanine aminopeptidase domain-containing protein n=1 Tax=Castanea mollissima TaxID=60419 RepID=A0A8J4QJ02_9ROSI|nr:hypothetical protein CMV_026959 [Castanea mollissima]
MRLIFAISLEKILIPCGRKPELYLSFQRMVAKDFLRFVFDLGPSPLNADVSMLLTIAVAHEVAHQWFGNLVTMEWWSHLWLNKGFAKWISYMATDIMFPDWKIWTQFLLKTNDGLCTDALEQSHPIEDFKHRNEHHQSKFIDTKEISNNPTPKNEPLILLYNKWRYTNVRSIEEIFDSISYKKGSAVI